jgi:hypothetical protein
VAARPLRRAPPARPAPSPGPRDAAAHHRVYVVLLRNPRGDGRDGYYVGMTGLSPEARFENHLRGHKAARIVTRCGVRLAPEWYEGIPPMPFAEAALTEPTLADELRDRGFIVYGPTNRPLATRRRRRKRR